MYRLKKTSIFASEIAEYLDTALIGSDIAIKRPCSLANAASNSLVYVKDQSQLHDFDFCQHSGILFLIPGGLSVYPQNHAFLISKNSRLDFFKIVDEFFMETSISGVASSANISPDAKLERNVSIGENVFIGANVIIKENTEILNNVVINGMVEIGRNCIVKDNSTIGTSGYNFELDEKGRPLHFPSIGKIIIGDHVLIGSNTTIESASIDNTIIGNYVKIDDLVHIGHNSCIGDKSMITAGVVVSRNVTIGEGCIIAPNSSLRENVNIGDRVIVGTGSVVVSNLESDKVYVGNPAKFLKGR